MDGAAEFKCIAQFTSNAVSDKQERNDGGGGGMPFVAMVTMATHSRWESEDNKAGEWKPLSAAQWYGHVWFLRHHSTIHI